MYLPILYRRVVEPIFLGIIANLVINAIFYTHTYDLKLSEFIVAIGLFVPITEMNRYINWRLEGKISWKSYPIKRFVIHFLLIVVSLIIALNLFGHLYLYITQQSFFSWKELLIINLVTLFLAVLLTFIKWAVQFYNQWVSAESHVSASVRMIDELKRQLVQPAGYIEVEKGNSQINIEIPSIRLARVIFGIVRVYSDEGICGTFPHSLTQLTDLLPDQLFFQVSRDAILHKCVIKSITSAAYGKILVTLHAPHDNEHTFTVSRTKAAAFRKWYNSSSV